MKFRITLLLVALPAVVAGLLVASPSSASNYDAYVTTRHVAIDSDGIGRVHLACHTSHTCKGELSFGGGTRTRSYSVPGHSTRSVEIATRTTELAYPYASNGGSNAGHPDYYSKPATIHVNENYPRNISHDYVSGVETETLVLHQTIKGHINPIGAVAAGRMTHLVVQQLRVLRGGSVEVLHSSQVTEGGAYDFNANLGANNGPSNPYQLRISGIDKDGRERSWYWRGSPGAASGGSRYIRQATSVQATKDRDFVADFNYSSIKGTVTGSNTSGTEVTIAAPPPIFSSTPSTLRELDIPSCADIFGHTTTDGAYQVDFLPVPATDSANDRYMIGIKSASGNTEVWNGETTEPYGSCHDATNYEFSKSNLITLTGPLTHNMALVQSDNNLTVNAPYSGFSPTSLGDRWITIREKVPGLTVLESPVVAKSSASKAGGKMYRTFHNLPPGEFWVEVGRRTGCSAWYASRFPNNTAYFNGLDRGAEAWKTVAGRVEEYAKSVEMGYHRQYPPSGYKGWMYRDTCKAYNAGTINAAHFTGNGTSKAQTMSTDHKGAVVSGHVARSGGRTNKEIMVRLSSSSQTLVLRNDVTDGSGNFYVAGLATGTYTVSVNSDSWRGIGRSFSGHHTIHVTAGHSYSLGRLGFYG